MRENEFCRRPTLRKPRRWVAGYAGFDDEIWKSHRFEIVVRGNLTKFQQSSVLGEWLQDTSEDIIAEASPVEFSLGHRSPR